MDKATAKAINRARPGILAPPAPDRRDRRSASFPDTAYLFQKGDRPLTRAIETIVLDFSV